MINVTHQISAVQRRVGARTLPAGEARVVTISQTYQASLADVWDACTSAERLPRWFLPVSGELREGGKYQLEGNASGTIERCDPPHSFAATWEFGDQVSWIEVRLSEQPDGGTRLELEHVAHLDDHWVEYGPGAAGAGWDMAFVGLALHLATGAAVDAAEFMAWLGTDDGRQFIALSSEQWCEANIAAGADPAQARAAAERTTAFYTG